MITSIVALRFRLAHVNWKAIGLFYGLACAFSYGLHFLPNLNAGILPVHDIFTYGMGPLLAALLTKRIFPDSAQAVTVLGPFRLKTLLFVATPIVLSVCLGVSNRSAQNTHLYAFLLSVSGVLYGFGEEMGWRGWLHGALRPLPTGWRAALVGLMHAGWHLTFLPNLSTVSGGQVSGLVVIGILMLMAWGMGALIDKTRSVLVVACAHEVMNIAVSPVTLALTLLVWIWLGRNWRKPFVLRLGRMRIGRTAFGRLVTTLLIPGVLLSGPVAFAQVDSLPYGSVPKEEIGPGKAENFTLFDSAFYQHQLFLLGESHGVQRPQEIDFDLLKHLNQRLGVRYYIAEVDATKAYYLNQYLQTGDEATLLRVFQSWIAEKAQWANKDFFRKIGRIRALNQSLPLNRRIQFVGIDRIHDRALVAERLTELLRGRQLPPADRALADSLVVKLTQPGSDSLAANLALTWLDHWQQRETAYRNALGTAAEPIRDLLTNVSYLKTIKSRETTIFTNFNAVLPRLGGEKLYGFWGFFHVLQRPPLGSAKPFACRVKESGMKVISITCSYLDSYSMVPTAYLPPFWQDKSGRTYTRLDKFNNDSELMHTEGIEAMRAATRPHSSTLFALDRPGSFAQRTPVRIRYASYMPQKLEFDPQWPMTEYFQYVLLVRDSDMTEPLVP